jgi:hypothetical protein
VKISVSVSRNETSLVVAGGLCFGSSEVPLDCGASSSVDARFRFAGGRDESDCWTCGGAADVPFATTSAADIVFVYPGRSGGLRVPLYAMGMANF